MSEVLNGYLSISWTASTWRQRTGMVLVTALVTLATSLVIQQRYVLILASVLLSEYIWRKYLGSLPFFDAHPTKLNFFERHATNLWERV